MAIYRVDYYGLRNRLLLRKQIRGACVLSYDSWKANDTATERESDLQLAVDEYQLKVWDEVSKLSERGKPQSHKSMVAFEEYRDQLHDFLLDDRHPAEAAQAFLEWEE